MDKQLDVRDAAIVQMLTTLPTKWRNVARRTLSDAQQKALERLIRGGLVDARIEAVGWMDNFPQVVQLRALVIGEYRPLLIDEVLNRCKAWKSSDGSRRDGFHCGYEVMEVRLTEDGELAREDLTVRADLFPVQFIKGGGSAAGRVSCEWFGVEVQGSPDAAREFAMSERKRLERLADGPDEVVQVPPAAGDGSIETCATEIVASNRALTREEVLSQPPAPIGQQLRDADPAELPDMNSSYSSDSPIERAAEGVAEKINSLTDPAAHVSQIPDDLITQERAGEILECSRKTVTRRIDDGTVRAYGPKGRRKVSQAEIESKRPQMLDRKPRRRNRSSRTANSKGTQ